MMRIYNTSNMNQSEKNDMVSYIEQMLVSQAVSQHMEKDKDLVQKGPVIAYKMDEEEECLLVTYANGETWVYHCIDEGADGMLYRLKSRD